MATAPKPMKRPSTSLLNGDEALTLVLDLFPWAREFRSAPVREYAACVFDAASPASSSGVREHAKSLLASWIQQCANRQGFDADRSDRFATEIVGNSVLQTAGQLRLLLEPQIFYDHVFSLLGLKARDSHSYIHYSRSAARLVDPSRHGPGFLTVSGHAVNLFGLRSNEMSSRMLTREAGGYRFQLKNAGQSGVDRTSLVRLASELPSGEFPSPARAIRHANAGLWRLMAPGTDLLQLDDSDVGDLVTMHLSDKRSWLCNELFANAALASEIQTSVERLENTPWRGFLANDTYFFWGFIDGQIYPLHLEGGNLTSGSEGAIHLPFTPFAIADGLLNGILIPGPVTNFLVLAMLPGVRLLGDLRYAVCLALMRYALCIALTKEGGDLALLRDLIRDERPCAWGNGVIAMSREPLSILLQNRKRGVVDFVDRVGNISLQSAGGPLLGVTTDPRLATLARSFGPGFLNRKIGPWSFS